MGDGGMDDHKKRLDIMLSQVSQIEKKVLEVEQFYLNNNKKQVNSLKGGSAFKDKDRDRERHAATGKKQQQDTVSKEEAASKRMEELIRQFGKIIHQITQHKWAQHFMEPVDVEGLGLHDYYELIEKPMDFSTIKKQMEAKDGSGYKHVREICSDVRLIFKNAMKYNDEKNVFHVMAKALLEKFEEKWRRLLPKVVEEEKRREEEEAEAHLNVQLAQEAKYAKMARDVSNELFKIDMHLEELREQLVRSCRKMSTAEKRQLGTALTQLTTEDLSRALDIVAQSNPGFTANAEEVDLDIDAQSESTLWRLKILVKDALQTRGKPTASMGGNIENKNNSNINNTKRKKQICDALAKTSKKKSIK